LILPRDPAGDPLTEFKTQLEVLRQLAGDLRRPGLGPVQGVTDAVRLVPPEQGERVYREVVDGAHSDVRSMTAPPFIAGSVQQQTEREISVLKRGVRIRGLYASEAIDGPDMVDHVRRVRAAGESSRVLPKVPLKLAIADDALALLTIPGANGLAQFYLRVGPSGLLDGLMDLFEVLWAFATPFPDRSVMLTDPNRLGAVDHDVLMLLVAGATDETIARQLGISLRTVQRRVRRLQELLGAQTRFQAGIQAARRGWV
jgi:DNA-binding CsgD family transcriptional regulator